jgi:very-short-patch-repair endonuclease
VKNLENVQGDERDVMMFSITFGPDAAGKFPVDFGAINRDGGERRLNVAITRARQELVVVASFLPDQLRAERSQARGVHDLKAFLEYADKGPEALVRRAEGPLGGFESPLEEAVAESLKKLGWHIETQIGVSGFRIDLGVVHPDRPGAYLAGVECDGMTYHRSAMARDRDKTRQQVLENLGWNIARVWSTDWWYDPDGAIRQLHATLNTFLETSRSQQAEKLDSDSSGIIESVPELEWPSETVESDPAPDVFIEDAVGKSEVSPVRPQLVAGQAPARDRVLYVRADLGDANANQDRFFDTDYSETLKSMALTVLKTQCPIRDDALAREVARSHGFSRTGNRIKERVLDLLPYITKTVESVGTFLWNGPSSQPSIPFRFAPTEEERRSLDEIAMPELIGLVNGFPGLDDSDDPALALAREIGLARLSRSSRERLEEAIEAARGLS